MIEIPIHFKDRNKGKSKIPKLQILISFFDLISIKLKEIFIKQKFYEINKTYNFEIKCNGFMFHPPIELSNEEKIRYFNEMNKIFSKYPDYSILSMGTSNDYHLANKCGATLNRLGRVLFE